MNWLKEENCFHRWLTVNPLPADVQALWNKLMYFNNISVVKYEGKWLWTRDFRVSNDTLAASLQVSKTQIDRLRNRLIQSERILYKKGVGSKGGVYSFIPFDDSVKAIKLPDSDVFVWIATHNVMQNDIQPVIQPVIQTDIQPVTQTADKSDSYDPIIINNKYIYKQESIAREGGKSKKLSFGERGNVLLTESEYAVLCRDYPNADEAIAYLDEHIAMKGYTAKSHYLALRRWVFDALREQSIRRAETDEREKRLAAKNGAPQDSDRLQFDLSAIYETPEGED